MTLERLLHEGKTILRGAQIEEGDLDAWYLLEYVSGCTRKDYFLYPDREATEEIRQRYAEMIRKRSMHIPLQHLTKSQEFMGYTFCVSEDVLIPRQDTEILVEEAVKYICPGMKILDLCTGSGCILLSILKMVPDVEGTGSDLSEKALLVAEQNRKRLDVPAFFVQSDLFEQVEGRYDCILSNPPYIPSEVIGTLAEEVREHEPRMALDGREDGLYYYGKIIRECPGYLLPQGMLFLEIGYDQAEPVRTWMEKEFTDIHVVKDLSGLDRVVCGRLKSRQGTIMEEKNV